MKYEKKIATSTQFMHTDIITIQFARKICCVKSIREQQKKKKNAEWEKKQKRKKEEKN